jgi:hypothetical protein
MASVIAFIKAHDVAVIVIFNIFMSAVAQVFAALGKAEPSLLQKFGAWGLKISQWLSANTPTPPPSA